MFVNNIEIFLKKKKQKDMENLPKKEKQRLVEYGKIYSRMQNANED